MAKSSKKEVPTYSDLKREEVLWEGRQYELSFQKAPEFESIKKTVEKKLSDVREQMAELYPQTDKMGVINEWLREQANLLAVAFWNDVHEHEEDYIWNSVVNHITYYVYPSTTEDTSEFPHRHYQNGGFCIYEAEPWADDDRARLVCATKDTPVISPQKLYTKSKQYGYDWFECTDFQKEYTWKFTAYFFRALRRNNIQYQDKFKVITDRTTFHLELF